MKALNEKLECALYWVCAVLMALMVLDVSWQVLSRFILKNPSSFSEELARFLLIWIGFFGAAYAFRKYSHLGLDIVTSNLESHLRVFAERFADAVCLLFFIVIMVFGGAKIMTLTLTLNQLSPALQVPMGYVYSVIPISGLLMCSFAIERLVFGRPHPDSLLGD